MNKIRGFSIRNFIWLMLAALMVLTIFLGGYNMYALSVYRKDLVNSSVNAVNLYADNFEKVLRDTEKYCSAKVSQGADYGVLRRKADAIDAVINEPVVRGRADYERCIKQYRRILYCSNAGR